jgi:hypothetical protein
MDMPERLEFYPELYIETPKPQPVAEVIETVVVETPTSQTSPINTDELMHEEVEDTRHVEVIMHDKKQPKPGLKNLLQDMEYKFKKWFVDDDAAKGDFDN